MKQETNTPAQTDTPFTGGEWQDSGLKKGSHWIIAIIKDENDKPVNWFHICSMDIVGSKSVNSDAEREANARLIAEAKNMYEALQEYLKVINRTDAAKHYYGKLTDKIEEILSRINNK